MGRRNRVVVDHDVHHRRTTMEGSAVWGCSIALSLSLSPTRAHILSVASFPKVKDCVGGGGSFFFSGVHLFSLLCQVALSVCGVEGQLLLLFG